MKGSCSETPLAEVIRDLYFDRRDGVLKISDGERNVELYFDKGTLFYCTVDSADQRLDRLLVRWGLVKEEEVGSLVSSAGSDVRSSLVQAGVFPDPGAFDEFMAQVLRERMTDVFALERSFFEFTDQDVSALHSMPFPTSTPNIILEGVRRLPDAESLLGAFIEDDPQLSVNLEPAVPMSSLHLGPSEGYVLAQLDGQIRISDIARTSPLSEGDTLRLLYGLLVLDIARHPDYEGYRFCLSNLATAKNQAASEDEAAREAIEKEYQRARAVDLFQVVAADPSEPDAYRQALLDHQSRWDSENFSEQVAKDMRTQLAYISGRCTEALLAVISDGRKAAGVGEGGTGSFGMKRMELNRSRAQDEQAEARSQARALRQHAADAMRKKDFHSAIIYLREALKKDETAELQEMLGDALGQNPHWRKKSEEAYLRAMELNQYNAEIAVKLANTYARAGLVERAKAMYKKALERQAEHPEAKEGLKKLKRR
ncbi:MAG: DUF4388 domain-containing protein [Acidobacteriota bacterium]